VTESTVLAEPCRTVPPFVLVTGGKGGVGKTTVAANLGVELGRSGVEPVLCDLDFGLANLDVVLGVRAERTVEAFFDGESELAECLTAGPDGARLLAAGSGSYERLRPDPSRRERLHAAFRATDAGLVVGDSPAGIGEDVLDFAILADRVLVVTTPDPAAVTDAYGVIKALDAYARDHAVEVPTPEVLVNVATDAAEARSVADKLAGVCERFLARSPRLVAWLPRSESVQRGVIERSPFVLRDRSSVAAKNVARLARRYAGFSRRRTETGVSAPPKASVKHGR